MATQWRSISYLKYNSHNKLTFAALTGVSPPLFAASLPPPAGAFPPPLVYASLPPSADVLFLPLHAAFSPPPPSYSKGQRMSPNNQAV